MKEEDYNELLAEGEEEIDLALELVRLEKWEDALSQFENAEKTFLKINHLQWLTFLRHEKVNCYHALGRLGELDQLVDEAIQSYLGTDSHRGLSLFLTHLAQLYQSEERDQKALACLYSALAVAQSNGVKDALGPIYGNLAVQLLLHEEAYQAIFYLQQALDCYDEEAIADRAWLFEKLALAFQTIYQHEPAEEFFLSAIEGYINVGQKALANEVTAELADLYQAGGKHSKAAGIRARLT